MQKKIVVLGGGESGVGAALLAKKQGYSVFVSDFGEIPEKFQQELIANEIGFEEGKHTAEIILAVDLIVKSPGIPNKAPIIVQAKEAEIKIIGEIEFASLYSTVRTIGITGSNGKTTTTMLTNHLLTSNGANVAMGGNIGKSYARLVAEEDGSIEWYVLELSSFQLDDIDTYSPQIGMILNITKDHLDRYDYKLENYIQSKFRITKNLKPEEVFLYNVHNENSVNYLNQHESLKRVAVGVDQDDFIDGKFTLPGTDFIFDLSACPLKGIHNYFNAYCAAYAAKKTGLVSDQQIQSALLTFANAPHRLEFVATYMGVDFINDSKATNVDSVYYALQSMTKRTILILGGVDKGNDYNQILDLVRERVFAIIALGLDSKPIFTFFEDKVQLLLRSKSMDAAVDLAYTISSRGDVILLSPACASFDLFKNYEDRGDQFKKCVLKLGKSKTLK